jgi:hypothetical protein
MTIRELHGVPSLAAADGPKLDNHIEASAN